MKGVVVSEVKQLDVLDFPIPEATEGYVTIKVKYCGVCGSDRHFWEQAWIKGVILGHEFIGTVSDPGASSFRVGERVAAMAFNPCGECAPCKRGEINLCPTGGFQMLGVGNNGGFGEYVKVREDMVRRLPDNVSDKQAALIEPTTVAMHGLNRGGVGEDSRVLITGAGAIGLLAAAGAKALGAAFVGTTARNPQRIALAESQPYVDQAFDGKDESLKETILGVAGEITHVIECSGSDAMLGFAADILAPGGKIVVIGQPSDDMRYLGALLQTKEASLLSSFIFTPDDFDQVIKMMGEGKLDVEALVTDVIGPDDVQETFEEMDSGKKFVIKVLLEPGR